MRAMILKKKSFTFLEALMAIGTMVVALAAILSAFLSSSNLRSFSENFTIGINACQRELERIRFHYEKDIYPASKLTFPDLLTDYNEGTGEGINGRPFAVLNEDGTVRGDFRGVVVSEDPQGGERLVVLTARVAFREKNRIIGGDKWLIPLPQTPCQLSTAIYNLD